MSTYDNLSKIYYKDSANYEKIYQQRFNSPTTKHFNIVIKQYNRKNSFSAFLCYNEEIVLLVEQIYKNYQNFLSTIQSVPSIVLTQFTLFSIVSEVKSTNDIEGVHSTRREISEVLQGLSNSPRFSSVINKYNALLSNETFNFNTCPNIRNFYDDFVYNEVIANNQKNKLDGKIFRKDPVDIDSPTGKILHQGLYPEQKIIDAMTEALQILNDEKMPFLIRISLFHYFFGYIHPFYDGNGRTARFITSYFLAGHFHYLAALKLSLTIKRQKKKYYDLFKETDSEINRGDLTPFVKGFLEIIADTFNDIEFLLNRKINQLVRYSEKLTSIMPSDPLTQKIYQILLQATSFFGQGLSMEDLMALTGKSRNTIKSRLQSVSEGHILASATKKIFYKLNTAIFLDY